MANPSKDFGTASETLAVGFLRANGFPGAERRALRGRQDVGDINVCPGVIAEVKARRGRYSDAEVMAWLQETLRERENAHASIGFLIIRRMHHPAHSWWAVHLDRYNRPVFMFLADYADQLHDQGWGDNVHAALRGDDA